MKPTVLVMSCEHAVNTIPPHFQTLLTQQGSTFKSNRAFDFGALDITLLIHKALGADYTQSHVSRLLIDCDRTLVHSRCFSKYSKHLPEAEKQTLIDEYYLPFREKTQQIIESHIAANEQVLHLSIHTFTPILKGFIQSTGLGLLYDSHRHGEKEVARIWHGLLLQQTPIYRIRMNYPYSGNRDNFTKALRHDHGERDYLGMELEINQALLQNDKDVQEVAQVLSTSLRDLLELL